MRLLHDLDARFRAMDEFGLKGTIKVFGSPAEEQLISRPYYVRDGHFDDVDVAIHDHVAGAFYTVYGLTHMAAVSAYFTFLGEGAHASTGPWFARDALDAVVLMDMGMAPGAALSFMVAGGVTSIPAAMAVFALVRRQVFVWYLLISLSGSMAAGLLYQLALGA